MTEFTLHLPTKIFFGKEVITSIGDEAGKFGKKALILYGGGSIKRNGVYTALTDSLRKNNIEIVEFSGVKPNPILSHTEEGIELVNKQGIDCIVAAGGGSVIDEGKGIAIGSMNPGPLWNYYNGTSVPEKALPLFAVQTMPATSSEMNMISVLTNEEFYQKFSCKTPLIYPKAAYLDPSVTLTIPPDQTAFACTDIMAHLMEGYFSNTDPWPVVQMGYAEGIMRAVKLSMDRLLQDFSDYQARAAVMWAGTLAWNGIVSAGLSGAKVSNHMLGHPMSAYYDITHGASLSIILPAWLKFHQNELEDKLNSFGKRVLDMDGSQKHAPKKVIETLENWYAKINTPVRFSDLDIPEPDVEKLTRGALEMAALWGISDYTAKDIEQIYTLAL